jgi:hypothetical protein
VKIARRTVLIGAGGLLIAAPAAFMALRKACAVYDSRVAESALFAAEAQASGARPFDIAHEEAAHWRGVRAGLAGPLIGLTRWSDWTILRGALEAQGRRVRSEVRLDYRPDARTAQSALDLLLRDTAERAVTRGAAKTLFAWRIA